MKIEQDLVTGELPEDSPFQPAPSRRRRKIVRLDEPFRLGLSVVG